jgi:hypothetical protein
MPQLFRQPIGRHRPPRFHEQQREQRALPCTSERQRRTVPRRFDRPKDAELRRRSV